MEKLRREPREMVSGCVPNGDHLFKVSSSLKRLSNENTRYTKDAHKFLLRLLLCILGLFLPPNFTLSFHYSGLEVPPVRIQNEDK